MNESPKVKFITLGCKVNQYETQAMRESFEKQGAESTRGPEADFVVINTCTVTEEADKENRYWVRRARRDYPNARIVVTGCGVERNRREWEAVPEADLIVSNHEKSEIAGRLLAGCGTPAIHSEESDPRKIHPKRFYTPLSISRTEGNGRAFVKIQDGCNHSCSFCKVVLVRGRSRSRGLEDILEEVKRLRDSGYKEIVFAGIQLGAYGEDLLSSNALVQVLEESSKIEGVERLRLSSIEPTDVRPSLIEALANITKCVPHLHIPLQSGDDEVLERMNRRYGRSFYIDLIARLKQAMPDFSLTLDVMAGFPGETAAQFQNTVDLIEQVRPLRCHVFPYSRREGTRAADFEDLPEAVVRQRVKTLMALSARIGDEIRRPYAGKTVPVLVEETKKKSGLLAGLTPNYLKVFFQGSPGWVGKIVPVNLLTVQGEIFLGRAAEKEGVYGMASPVH